MQSLSVQEALNLILEKVEPTKNETIPITLASQRILAEDLKSKITNPPFDTSAMDGYALKKEDIVNLPVRLKVIGESRAGFCFNGSLGKQECVRIFTGAPIPSGADHVVIQECTDKCDDFVDIKEHKITSSNIRKRGGDFDKGSVLLHKGCKLDSRAIMLTASMGHSHVCVQRKPKIAILATGDELVEPGVVPDHNQIISSNTYGLLSLIQSSGADAFLLGIAKDSLEELISKFLNAEEADVIVTTGGVSVGDYDLVAPAFLSLGMEVKFWNITMKPGKPMLYGKIGNKIILGLPGNPISALLTARIFLVPLIDKLLNFKRKENYKIRALLMENLEANGPRQHFMRAQIIKDRNGNHFVTPQPSQDSSLVSQFAKADALIVREINAPEIQKNTEIEVLPIDF